MSKYKVGNIVTTTAKFSKYGAKIPAGPFLVSIVYVTSGELALQPLNATTDYIVKESDVRPYVPTFKPGDVVEVLLDCKDPVFEYDCLAGTRGIVLDPVTYGDGFIRIGTSEHGNAHQGYFTAQPQNLRLVTSTPASVAKSAPALKVGDQVTTDRTESYYGSPVPPGPLYVHEIYEMTGSEPERALVYPHHPRSIVAGRESVVIETHHLTLAKPTGWTFRVRSDEPIDGKRVLRELAKAGADYAVVSWGKRETQRVCLVSHRLALRAQRAEVALVNGHLIDPECRVVDFGRTFFEVGQEAHYCYTPSVRLADLEDYAARVARAERPTTVRVNFGVAK